MIAMSFNPGSYRYSNYKQKEIGAIFGVDYSTVSQSRSRLKTKLK